MHRPLALAVVAALRQIFGQQRAAEPVVAQTLSSNPRWGARDRRFIAEAIYDIVRHPYLPQIADLAYFPHHWTDEQAWQLLAAWQILREQALPDWTEFADIDPDQVKKSYTQAQQQRSTRHVLPLWLDQFAAQALGDELWTRELAALDQIAPVFVRVNRLKATSRQVIESLAKNDIKTQSLASLPDALHITERKNIAASNAYRKGWIEIQDAGSQQIAPFCGVQAGMTVIDACAGAGGKTLHLAALMQNKGTIVAMDTDRHKLEVLEQRAQRAGISIIRTRHLKNPKIIERYQFSADRLLLDVPCTGLGTLRRHPDLKWQLSPDRIAQILTLQADILARYSTMLHPEGQLIYATCSILPAENEAQIAHFLQKNTEQSPNNDLFTLLQQQHISPAQTGFDGFYMAKLRRTQL